MDFSKLTKGEIAAYFNKFAYTPREYLTFDDNESTIDISTDQDLVDIITNKVVDEENNEDTENENKSAKFLVSKNWFYFLRDFMHTLGICYLKICGIRKARKFLRESIFMTPDGLSQFEVADILIYLRK